MYLDAFSYPELTQQIAEHVWEYMWRGGGTKGSGGRLFAKGGMNV
jgi:hypothetical protein